jgi:putative aldouronate transport system substrate-binding protein
VNKGKKSLRKLITVGTISASLLVGCSTESSNESKSSSDVGKSDKLELTIMTQLHGPDAPKDDSPAEKAIEEFTNSSLKMEWVPASNYDERFNITVASGKIPHIIVANPSDPSFIQAAKDGAFWDLTDFLADYENLSQLNEIVAKNISVEGRIYGLPRSRPLGRNGVVIRKDWLQNLGLEIPKNTDEFYNVLKAFTNDDPDGNGKDDTYGMTVTNMDSPWNEMQIWFGAPNEWGLDENGKLQPNFMTKEYREALKFFKKLYDEGLVNEDFAVRDVTDWSKAMINGESGLALRVADEASIIQASITEANPELTDVIDVFGAVEGPNGHFAPPTTGFNRILAISKTSVKTEEELKNVLAFLDKLNTEEGQRLGVNGVEGRHYEVVDGKFNPLTKDDKRLLTEHAMFGQIMMAIPEERHLKESTPLIGKQDQVMKDNLEIVVGNPAQPLIAGSETYAKVGSQLDNIIKDARIKYIVGQIDEKGLDEAIALWERSGGKEFIKEINEAYEKSQK